MRTLKNTSLGIIVSFLAGLRICGAATGDIVQILNYEDAALRSALADAGTVQCAADGTAVLTNEIVISQPTVLDANNHQVTISGNGSARLFRVIPGGSLTLKGLTLSGGTALGTDGAEGQAGADAAGGAVHVDGGILTLIDCRVWTNSATAGNGGSSFTNMAAGGHAYGGAIYLLDSRFFATNCEFAGNTAIAGSASVVMESQAWVTNIGSGGSALGGTVFSLASTSIVANCTLHGNTAVGGEGGEIVQGFQGDLAPAGLGYAGAFCVRQGAVLFTTCVLSSNVVQGGIAGSVGFNGYGVGGDSTAGAIHNEDGAVTIVGSSILGNLSLSGKGKRFFALLGPSGKASAGALSMVAGTTVLSNVVFRSNTSRSELYTSARGGALTVLAGALVINNCEFNGNAADASSGTGGAAYLGGGTNLIMNSTFSGNCAQSGANCWASCFGIEARGGGIFTSSTLEVVNSTFIGNEARSGSPAYIISGGYGGAICNAGGSVTLLNATVVGNRAVDGEDFYGNRGTNEFGAGIYSTNGSFVVRNTLLASNSPGGNASGNLTDAGHNLSSDASYLFSAAGSMNSVDPKLGPLGYYGGPTPTLPLLAGSPALNSGDPVVFPPFDQRGRGRPFGAAPDIGAFESSHPYVISGLISGPTLKHRVAVESGQLAAETTDTGSYRLEVPTGDHTLAPQHEDYLFLPAERLLTAGPDQFNVDFRAYHWSSITIESVTNGVLRGLVAEKAGELLYLQGSSDLKNWIGLATNLIGSDRHWEFVVPTSEHQIQFFRTARAPVSDQ